MEKQTIINEIKMERETKQISANELKLEVNRRH